MEPCLVLTVDLSAMLMHQLLNHSLSDFCKVYIHIYFLYFPHLVFSTCFKKKYVFILVKTTAEGGG